MAAAIQHHTRINTGVLASAERRTLLWLASRLPPWVHSDHLTTLALAAMAGAGASFAAARYWPPALVLVVVALAVNWFGDSLDGTLARVRKQERPRFGYYVDHVLDIGGISLLMAGMAASGLMSPLIGLTLLAAYLLVSAEVFLATAVNGVFRLTFMRLGPTELRILLSLGALVALKSPVVTPFGMAPFFLFDVGGAIGIVGLVVAFIVSASRTTLALYRAEPRPVAATKHDSGDAARGAGDGATPCQPRPATLRNALLLAAAMAVSTPQAWGATLEPHMLTAWNAYVAAAEARIRQELAAPTGFLASDFSPDAADVRARVLSGDIVIAPLGVDGVDGASIGVPSATVSHWRGAVFLPGVTLETLLRRVQNPAEHGPHQQDVLALRVLAREPDRLRLFIKMARTKVVTVTYNTEHEIVYRRHGQTRVSSRSVATKIAELEAAGTASEREKASGQDRGFMWRLHSYWRYEQVANGVIVELESLTLSRGVPLGLGVIVNPIIERIARESMDRTLDNVRHTYTRPQVQRAAGPRATAVLSQWDAKGAFSAPVPSR